MNVCELRRAFSFSGINLDQGTLNNIMRSYDFDLTYHEETPLLPFDAFVQLRIEMELYYNSFTTWQGPDGLVHINFEGLLNLIYKVRNISPNRPEIDSQVEKN